MADAQATPHALLKDKVDLSDRTKGEDDNIIDMLVGLWCIDGQHQAMVRRWGSARDADTWSPLDKPPKHLALRYPR